MVRFIYSTSNYDNTREQVITNVFMILSTLIQLPQQIEVEFSKLPNNIYGETILDPRFKDRFRLSESLSARESIIPTIHELVHISQMHLGQLKGQRDGTISWCGNVYRISRTIVHSEWKTLPWEEDVASRETELLAQVLSFKSNNH